MKTRTSVTQPSIAARAHRMRLAMLMVWRGEVGAVGHTCVSARGRKRMGDAA